MDLITGAGLLYKRTQRALAHICNSLVYFYLLSVVIAGWLFYSYLLRLALSDSLVCVYLLIYSLSDSLFCFYSLSLVLYDWWSVPIGPIWPYPIHWSVSIFSNWPIWFIILCLFTPIDPIRFISLCLFSPDDHILFIVLTSFPLNWGAVFTFWASLSGTFLQTLPDLVPPLKGHSLSPRSCPPTRSAPSERCGY